MAAIQDQNMAILQERSLPWALQVGKGVEGVDYFAQSGFGTIATINEWKEVAGFDFPLTIQSAAVALFISSSSAADTQDVTVHGYDANGKHQIVTQTLAGQAETRIGSTETWLFQYKAFNADGTVLAGTVYIYEDDTVVAGVPQTEAKQKLKIEIGFGETQAAIAYIPPGKQGFVLKASGGASTLSGVLFRVAIKRPSGVFRTRTFGTDIAFGESVPEISEPIEENSIVCLQAFNFGADTNVAELEILLKDL